MKTLFISEEKEEWELIRRISKNLYGKDLEIICVNDNETAINTASSDGPFGFFLIDVAIKTFDPIELINTLIDLTGERPLLFVGNPVLIKDLVPDELFNSNEFNDILERPFSSEEIGDKFNAILKWAKKEEYESSIEEVDPEEFIPMRLKSFYLHSSFPYDIYMEITVGKYIRILSANKPYSISTLSLYAKKNVKFLHIRKDDQIKYLELESKKCIASLIQMPSKHKDYFILLLKSITMAHQYLIALGVNETVKELIEATTDGIMDCLEQRMYFKYVAKDYPPLYSGVASKSLMTAIIAGFICEKMGYNSKTTKKKLFIAAILMDFLLEDEALTQVNLLEDSILVDFGPADQAEFIKHPLKVAEIAAQFTSYSDLNILIANHHELPNREGFPNKPSHTSLTSLNAIFNIAQYFAAEIDGMKIDAPILKKTIAQMTRDYNIGTFKEVLIITKKVINLDS